jgi:serine/threonine protein kinase
MGSTIQIGQILNNRYRIENLLGRGGYGSVYKVWDLNLQRFCAIKESIDSSPMAQGQFKREATILAGLNHPNLPHVSDFFIVLGQGQYLVMDFVDGFDLESLLAKRGAPLREEQVLPWMLQICDALSYLHSQNPPVIHRDIKPANIRITPNRQAMLVDFGIAKTYSAQANTLEGARGVTPGFSPPEQYGVGKTDERSDIYSLAATLYCLLTNQTPTESIRRALGDGFAPGEGYTENTSPAVRQAIERAMALEQDKRFATVALFKEALQAKRQAAIPAKKSFLHRQGIAIGAMALMVLVALCLFTAFTLLPQYSNRDKVLLQTVIVVATNKPTQTVETLPPTMTETEPITPTSFPTQTLTLQPVEASPTATPGAELAKALFTDTPTSTEQIDGTICDYQILAKIVARQGPGPNFKIISYLSQDTIITAVGRNDDLSWIFVLLPSGRKGWIATTSVKIVDPFCRLPVVINTLTPEATKTPGSGDGAISGYP